MINSLDTLSPRRLHHHHSTYRWQFPQPPEELVQLVAGEVIEVGRSQPEPVRQFGLHVH